MSRSRLPLYLVAMFIRLGQSALAQENDLAPKGDAALPIHRFFSRPVDYWQQGLTFEADKKPGPKESRHETARSPRPVGPSDWSQVVRQPDGTLAYRELPRPLVQVLEDPSPENIRAYFEWKLARTEKILRAAQAIKEYRGALPLPAGDSSDAPPPEAPSPNAGKLSQAPAKAEPSSTSRPMGGAKMPFTVTYFHRAGCSHCDHQDEVLAGWLKYRPEGKLEVVEFGARPELWRRFGVRGTPSLVIEDPVSHGSVFLEGLAQRAQLEQGLAQARLGLPEKMSGKDQK
jgi:hypothetical protein